MGLPRDQSSGSTNMNVITFLKKWDFLSLGRDFTDLLKITDEIMKFADKIEKKRDTFPLISMGSSLKSMSSNTTIEMGITGKSPRWAVAYKFAPEQALTHIHEITVQVGRTGVLTPVAELEPVFLAGSTIARATLHNQEEVERKDIRRATGSVLRKGEMSSLKLFEVDLKKRP